MANTTDGNAHLGLAVAVTGFRTVYIDYRTQLAHLSADAAALFGFALNATEDVIVPRTLVHERFHPEDRAELLARIARCLDPTGNGWFAMEHRIVHPDGTIRWLNVRKQVFFESTDESQRRPHHAILVAADITEQKAVAARLSLALESSRSGIYEFDCTTGQKLYAPRTFHLLGIPLPPEISTTGRVVEGASNRSEIDTEVVFATVDADTFWKQVHPEDRARVHAALNRAYDPDSHWAGFYEAEYRALQPDGSYHWIASRGRVVFDATGRRAVRLIGMLRDITESREAADALTRSESRFRVQADAMPQMVWATDANGNHLYYNRRWYEYTGQSEAESLGLGFALALHPDDRERTLARWRRAWEGGENYEIEYRFRRHDGVYRWFVGRAEPVRDPESKAIVSWYGTCTDIDDLKQAQAELERLYAEERAQTRRNAILAQIGDALRATDDPDEVQAQVVALLGDALRLDLCHVTVLDPARRTWTVSRDWHRPDLPSLSGTYPERTWQPLMDCLTREHEDKRRTSIIADVQDAEERTGLTDEARKLLATLDVGALVHVPLLNAARGAVAGLTAAMVGAPRTWTPDEITLIESAAALMRTAVEAARVHQRERNIARRLQRALQPPIPERMPGLRLASYYRPALDESEVGGDFFDAFAVGGGEAFGEDGDGDGDATLLVVADVSGKGLAAAQHVASVRNMLRFALHEAHEWNQSQRNEGDALSLARAVTRLNAVLVKQRLLAGFATAFIGLYSAPARRLTYVNCGQEPGLLWRAATGAVEILPPTGTVLGCMDGAAYDQRTVELATGDILALVTDGLTEAGPDRRTILGIDGVIDILRGVCQSDPVASPATVAAGLIQRIDAFAQDGVRDDVALLVAQVQPSDASPSGSGAGMRTLRG